MRDDALPLRGRQRLLHRLAEGRDLRVPRRVAEDLPALRLRPRDVRVQLELDREEAGLLRVRDQVALVEVEHRIGLRLDLVEDGVDLPREVA